MYILSLKLQFWSHLFIHKCLQCLKTQHEKTSHLTLRTREATFQALIIPLTTVQELQLKKVQTCFLIHKQNSHSLKFLKQNSRCLTCLKWRRKRTTTDLSLYSSITSQNLSEKTVKYLLRLSKILCKQKPLQTHFERKNSKLSHHDEARLKPRKGLKSTQGAGQKRKF